MTRLTLFGHELRRTSVVDADEAYRLSRRQIEIIVYRNNSRWSWEVYLGGALWDCGRCLHVSACQRRAEKCLLALHQSLEWLVTGGSK